jgi:hypothetical protein
MGKVGAGHCVDRVHVRTSRFVCWNGQKKTCERNSSSASTWTCRSEVLLLVVCRDYHGCDQQRLGTRGESGRIWRLPKEDEFRSGKCT